MPQWRLNVAITEGVFAAIISSIARIAMDKESSIPFEIVEASH
jgi:hypothetical protein